MRKLILVGYLLGLSTAQADSLDQAQKKLDAANAAAQHHRAAAAIAQREAAASRRQQADLVAQEITAAAALRQSEDQTAAIVAKLAALTQRTDAARAELQADAASIAPLLPLIARLALHPAATLLAANAAPSHAANAAPSHAADAASDHAAEGALVMQGLTREIGARARALRTAQARYDRLTADLTAQQTALTAAVTAQQTSDTALQADIAAVSRRASAATARQSVERAAATRAAATAHDLVGIIAQLQGQRRAAQAHQAAARLPTPLPQSLRHAPVAGRLVRAFGAATAAGPATGDTFAAAPGAIVGAACAGSVVFARPFESYGKLVILDCGGGYDFVMAGFDRLNVTVGQTLRAGQPLGAMAAYDPHNPGNQPRLYVELRDHGATIDPAGHFGGKASRR